MPSSVWQLSHSLDTKLNAPCSAGESAAVGGGGVSVGGSGVSVGGSGVSVGGSDVSVGGGGERTPQAVSAMVIITNDRKRMANFCFFIAGLTFSFGLPAWAKRPQYSDHGA